MVQQCNYVTKLDVKFEHLQKKGHSSIFTYGQSCDRTTSKPQFCFFLHWNFSEASPTILKQDAAPNNLVNY